MEQKQYSFTKCETRNEVLQETKDFVRAQRNKEH